MTIHLPENLENSILEVVQSGRPPSVDEAMAEAARLLLERVERHRGQPAPAADAPTRGSSEDAMDSREVQRRPFEAGILGEIKPLIGDPTHFQHRRAVPVQGEPLSETILRERR